MGYEPTIGKVFAPFGFRSPLNAPPADDILRTRLTALGVEQHHLALEGGQIEQRRAIRTAEDGAAELAMRHVRMYVAAHDLCCALA